MGKSLLLGNGINARIGIRGLSETEIKERFRHNIYKASPSLEALYGITLSEDICNDIIDSSQTNGIEVLAGSLYKYVKNQKINVWTLNDEIRLQDVVECIALTSIFYDGKGKICTDLNPEKLLDTSEYERIFTLNYKEFWDKMNECIYLHGRIDLDSFEDVENMLLVSRERNNLQEYQEAIKVIKKVTNVQLINASNIIFAPNCLEKKELINVAGVYPSDNLYPADDLFLHSKKQLYIQLEGVKELDIFGLSPYGDDSLIDIINRMESVTVYIHNMKSNKQTDEWDKILYCPHIFKDSLEI